MNNATIFLSDIHSNQAALQEVLRSVYDSYYVKELYCLGDVLGYGPEPYEVWRELHFGGHPIPENGWLAGNHEWGFLGKIDSPIELYPDNHEEINGGEHISYNLGMIRREAYEVILEHRNILHEKGEVREHLSALPVMSNPKPGIYLAHGEFQADPKKSVTAKTLTPLQPPNQILNVVERAYLQTPEDVRVSEGTEYSRPILFACGHIHKPRLWRWDDDRCWVREGLNGPLALGDLEKHPIFLNPGSVGFPRDGSCCPSYAAIDWDNERVIFHQIPYDIEVTRRKMEEKVVYRSLLVEKGFLCEPKC